MRTIALATLLVALAGATAHADDYTDENGEPSILAKLRATRDRTYGMLGFGVSDRELDQAEIAHRSLLFGLAVQRGAWTMIGEAQLGHVYAHQHADPALSGFALDAGMFLRRDAVSWLVGDRKTALTIGTWVDLGLAAELMWFDGDRVYRPKAALGIGGGFEVFERGLGFGFTLDVRIEVAPAIRWADGVAGRCEGACEMRFSQPDFTGMVVIGLPFSR